jgi:hypothetical protein
MLVRLSVPTEAGNAALRKGTLQKALSEFLERWKPEAAYFYADRGERAALFVIDLADQSQGPALLEPLWLATGCEAMIVPAMNIDDFMKAMPDIEAAVRNYP